MPAGRNGRGWATRCRSCQRRPAVAVVPTSSRARSCVRSPPSELNSDQKPQRVAGHDPLVGQFAERYERLPGNPYWDTFAYSRKKIDEVFDEYLGSMSPGGLLLDVGCGTGHQVKKYNDRGFISTGCDESTEMLRVARKVNSDHLRIQRSSVEALPYKSDSIDVVICIEVMRYLPNPEKALAEIHRVLRPGGLSLVTFAQKYSTTLYPLVNRLTYRAKRGSFSKLRQYFHTTSQLETLYGGLGFQDVDVHARFFGPFIYLALFKRQWGSLALRAWDRVDDHIARLPVVADLSNLYVVSARKPAG